MYISSNRNSLRHGSGLLQVKTDTQKYPIPDNLEIKLGMDWVLPKNIESSRLWETRKTLSTLCTYLGKHIIQERNPCTFKIEIINTNYEHRCLWPIDTLTRLSVMQAKNAQVGWRENHWSFFKRIPSPPSTWVCKYYISFPSPLWKFLISHKNIALYRSVA